MAEPKNTRQCCVTQGCHGYRGSAPSARGISLSQDLLSTTVEQQGRGGV